MVHVETLIVVTKTLTLGFGALITTFAWRAYRRTGEAPLGALAVGFAIVTLGALLGGILDLFTDISILWSIVFQSGLTALGFAVITYSLYQR